LGFAQLGNKDTKRGFGTPKISVSGFYGYVRHPIYTFTMAAFIITNEMSLDRLVATLGSVIYLYFAIPVEEKKLIQLFGRAYEDYRKEVPAVIPFFGAKKKKRKALSN